MKKTKPKPRRIHKLQKVPRWLNILSNKILPPVFFLFLAVISLYYIPAATTTVLKVNLGAVSITSTSLSIYLTMLML